MTKRAEEKFEEKDSLLRVSYDELADGGRRFEKRIKAKKVAPETEVALKRLYEK